MGRTAVWAIASRQYGRITSRQLLSLGLNPDAILHRVGLALWELGEQTTPVPEVSVPKNCRCRRPEVIAATEPTPPPE